MVCLFGRARVREPLRHRRQGRHARGSAAGGGPKEWAGTEASQSVIDGRAAGHDRMPAGTGGAAGGNR
jgi:hypothetical protein